MRFAKAACCIYAVLLGGCIATEGSPFGRPPYFKNELSTLDNIQFKFVPGAEPQDGLPDRTVVIEIIGNGYMTIVKGRSNQLDPFAHARHGHVPADERRDQVVLSEADTAAVFQKIIDIGVFDRRKNMSMETVKDSAYLVVLAEVSRRKNLQVSNRPEMMALFRSLVNAFH